MSQDFRPLIGTDTFGDSYGYLNDTALALLSNNSGPTEPASPVAFQFWADTTTGHLKVRNAANDDWVDWGALGSDLLGALALSGGTMTGPINMGAQQITNLGLGTGASAARQQEVDLKAPIAAPAFTGDAQVNQDPAGNNSLVRRSYTEGRYLKLAGGTVTGPIVLGAGNADADNEAVPRGQLSDYLAFNVTAGHRHTGSDARKVRGTDLDAAGSSSGQLLASAGSGSAPVWTTPHTYPYIAFIDPSLVVDIDTSNGFLTTSFQTVTASALPAGALAAVLNISMAANGFTFSPPTLRVRTTGSGFDSAGQNVGPIAIAETRQTLVGLNASKQFDWRSTLAGSGKGVLKIYVVGYCT